MRLITRSHPPASPLIQRVRRHAGLAILFRAPSTAFSGRIPAVMHTSPQIAGLLETISVSTRSFDLPETRPIYPRVHSQYAPASGYNQCPETQPPPTLSPDQSLEQLPRQPGPTAPLTTQVTVQAPQTELAQTRTDPLQPTIVHSNPALSRRSQPAMPGEPAIRAGGSSPIQTDQAQPQGNDSDWPRLHNILLQHELHQAEQEKTRQSPETPSASSQGVAPDVVEPLLGAASIGEKPLAVVAPVGAAEGVDEPQTAKAQPELEPQPSFSALVQRTPDPQVESAARQAGVLREPINHKTTDPNSKEDRTTSTPPEERIDITTTTGVGAQALTSPLEMPEPDPQPNPDNSGDPRPPATPARDASPTLSPGPAQPNADANQPLPLNAIWPVKRIDSSEQIQVDQTFGPSTPSTPAARVVRAQNTDNEFIRSALQSVAPEQPTSSHIELITPRAPRPQPSRPAILQRKADLPAQDQVKEMPANANPIGPEENLSVEQPLIPETQQIHAVLPPTQRMVPTEIGLLPSDLWSLIGEPAPTDGIKEQPRSETHPSHPSPNTPPTHIQRTVMIEDRSGEETGRQAEVEAQPSPSGQDAHTNQQPAAPRPGSSEINLEQLAQQVYAEIRTKLQVEWERLRHRL